MHQKAVPQFSPSDPYFYPLWALQKTVNLPKVIAKVRGFFPAIDNKTKEKICVKRLIFEFRR